MKHEQSGFTLIELLMVIAIIGIISTLAIQKLSGVKANSQEKINLANVQRIGNALENHMAINLEKPKLNKLDALVLDGAADGTAGATTGLSLTSSLMVYTNELNRGLSADLVGSQQNGYAATSASILGTYYLQDSEIAVLKRDLGIEYLMRGYPTTNPGGYSYAGEDGTYVSGSRDNADTCASVAISNKAGRAVAIVNPGATLGRSPVGPALYKACGMNVAYHGTSYKVMVNGAQCESNEDAFIALRNAGENGGILMAFGLGEHCSLIGSNVAGLDEAPISPIMNKDEYRRYIVLVRMIYTPGRGSAAPAAARAEFAGIMDPRGRTVSMLR